MNTSLITTNEHVDALSRVSKAMVASGYFTDAKDVAQAFVKVQAGAELGLPPVASMSGIHIVKGKPTLGANLIATLIKNDRRYNYRVLDLTDTICTIQFYEDGQACGVSEFTADDAKRAGTQNMAKFPKNMLFARAISNGAKWYTPGIFGGVTVYTAEELGVPVDEDGDIIDMLHTEPVDIDDGPQEPAPATNGANGPLPDDETVVMETSAAEFFTTVTALVPRFSHEKHTKAAAKKLGVTAIPGKPDDRRLLYLRLKEYARARDAEESAPVDELTGELLTD